MADCIKIHKKLRRKNVWLQFFITLSILGGLAIAVTGLVTTLHTEKSRWLVIGVAAGIIVGVAASVATELTFGPEAHAATAAEQTAIENGLKTREGFVGWVEETPDMTGEQKRWAVSEPTIGGNVWKGGRPNTYVVEFENGSIKACRVLTHKNLEEAINNTRLLCN